LVKIGKIEFPSILLGSSPFFGLDPQFPSEKAKVYQKKFLNPQAMIDIMKEAVTIGIKGFSMTAPNALEHILREQPLKDKGIIFTGINPPIIESLLQVEKELKIRVPCVSTVFDEESIQLVSRLDNRIMVTDGAITDKLDMPKLLDLADRVTELGLEFGIATHHAGRTIPRLEKKKEFWKRVSVVLCPVNKIGYYMYPTQEAALKAIENIDKDIIATKVFAGGRLPVKEGLSYISEIKKEGKIPAVKSLALGVASPEETRETFTLAKKVWKE